MGDINQITTKSYLIKRLKSCGYIIDRMDTLEYTDTDKRKFSLLLDNGHTSIIITVYKDGKIHFYDGARNHNINVKHISSSIQVLVEYLNDKGVINKHWSYGTKKDPMVSTNIK